MYSLQLRTSLSAHVSKCILRSQVLTTVMTVGCATSLLHTSFPAALAGSLCDCMHCIAISATHPLVCNCRHQSGMDEVNPYLSPLLEDPILPSPTPAADVGSGILHTCTDSLKGPDKKEVVAELLCDMSMRDAVQCITQFLRCNKRWVCSMG